MYNTQTEGEVVLVIQSVTPAKLHLYTVTLDDTCGDIDKTIWEHSGLSIGDELSNEQWEALCASSASHRAREKALYYLSLRDYGSGELIKKLKTAGIDGMLAATTVERLVESGLIDDERYACALARDMALRKLYPKRRVAMALREKGFDRETVSCAVEQLDAQEEQQALELLRKKGYNEPNDPKKREKALAMLARYGFSYAVAKAALDLRNEEFDEDSWE